MVEIAINKTMLILFLFLLFTSLAIYLVAQKSQRESYELTPTVQTYLKQVYPLTSSTRALPIEFLYACAPKQAFATTFFDPEKSKNYVPAPYGQWWRPVWFPAGAFTLNLYPPTSWWDYKYLDKYKDNSTLEAIHTRDDNPYYPVYGLWAYVAKGTGVFYNVGRTLLARNKIHALYLLGMTAPEIADFAKDKHYYYNPARPYESYYGGAPAIEYILTTGKNYELDRFNNTADFDPLITTMAKDKGYDSVQFQIQANGMGGWAHEIVYVSPIPLLKEKEVEWAGWSQMARFMSVRDPRNVNPPEPCQPVVSDDRDIVICQKQGLPASCLMSGASGAGYYPPAPADSCCCTMTKIVTCFDAD